MQTVRLVAGLIAVLSFSLAGLALGQGPVKWSVPINEYPRPWVPTMPPPQQYEPQPAPNPYGYQPQGTLPGTYNQGAFYGYPPTHPQNYQPGVYSGFGPQDSHNRDHGPCSEQRVAEPDAIQLP